MIRPTVIKSGVKAAGYYSDVARAAEYYQGEGVPSQWSGRAAEAMGLSGRVEQAALLSALEGRVRDAGGDRQLGRINKDGSTNHRAGYDFTISAPKSVSLAALVYRRDDVLEAHRHATAAALAYLEERAESRISGEVVRTGNLAIAAYEHVASRTGDPQLHTHALVANVTMHGGKAYSLESKSLFHAYRTADAVYHATLSRELQVVGYRVRHDRDGRVEIEDYAPRDLREFSARSVEIEKALAARGMTRESSSAGARNLAALGTRAPKNVIETRSANIERWGVQAFALGIKSPARNLAVGREAVNRDGVAHARDIVRQAVAHLSEREFVIKELDLHRVAAQFSNGRCGWNDIERVIVQAEHDGELIRRGDRFTTAESIQLEERMNAMLRQGEGAHLAVMTDREFDTALAAFEKRKGFELTNDQRSAARSILTGDDRFHGVQGLAGTGKTTMLELVREAAQSKGWDVIGHSNGSEQAAKLQAESGIRSGTTASHLLDEGRVQRVVDRDAELARAALRTWEHDQSLIGRMGHHASFDTLAAQGCAIERDSAGHRYIHDGEGGVHSEALYSRNAHLRDHDDLIEARDGHILKSKDAGKSWQRPEGVIERALAKTKVETRITLGKEKELARLEMNAGGVPLKQLRIMDEASQAGQVEYLRVMETTHAANARTIFLGDKHQHQSVQAGKAFELAQKRLSVSELGRDSMKRQKTAVLKAAVGDVLDGRHAEALRRVTTVEMRGAQDALAASGINAGRGERDEAMRSDNQTVIRKLAADYAALALGEREKTLVITSTNADRRAINDAIRADLTGRGELGSSMDVTTLRKVSMTDAESRRCESYQAGQLVQVSQTYKRLGLSAGQQFEVVESRRGNALVVRDGQGNEKALDPARVRLSAYEPEQRELAAGDRVRFTENHNIVVVNGDELRVRNGQAATVERVADGTIDLRIGDERVRLDSTAGLRLDHAYATTSFSAQGQTVDRAWLHHNTQGGAHGQRETYVNLTRAREEARIYTQDAEKAARQAGVEVNKASAIEFAQVPEAGRPAKVELTPEYSARGTPESSPGADFAARANRDRESASPAEKAPAQPAPERASTPDVTQKPAHTPEL